MRLLTFDDGSGAQAGILVGEDVVPVSALHGDNVVVPSSSASFYDGPTVLEALESAPTGGWAGAHGGDEAAATRLPVVLSEAQVDALLASPVTDATVDVRDRALLDIGNRLRNRLGCPEDTVVLLRPDDHVAAILPIAAGRVEQIYNRIRGRA